MQLSKFDWWQCLARTRL